MLVVFFLSNGLIERHRLSVAEPAIVVVNRELKVNKVSYCRTSVLEKKLSKTSLLEYAYTLEHSLEKGSHVSCWHGRPHQLDREKAEDQKASGNCHRGHTGKR